ncbi:MAG: hypothetical protein FWG72_06370 [Oscillospiraceae bacterium]|nr:hypothetical protein [Oscillospiraceae bacterium]
MPKRYSFPNKHPHTTPKGGENLSLLQALTAYADKQTARFHMPGHKGRLGPPFDGVAPLDLTELDGTGDLYGESDGAIRRSERRTAALYGAQDCFYLTGGATQGIYAMLSAVTRPGDTVHVARNCHRSVYNALALLDLRPVWFWDAPPSAEEPVIYTSPDYFGKITPRPDSRGLVLCDAAHGAHLPFCLDDYAPPGSLWVVSAHKTLPALGQTAMLLSDGTTDAELLRGQTAVFGTASPSFALLASLDAAVSNPGDWARIADFTRPYIEPGDDPAKITVYTPDARAHAARLAQDLGVVCELADAHRILFMLSPHNTPQDLTLLKKALKTIPPLPAPPVPQLSTINYQLSTALPFREAFFAPRKRVLLREAAGCVAARVFAPSPPGIPFFAPGERIDKKTLEILFGLCYTDNDAYIWIVR